MQIHTAKVAKRLKNKAMLLRISRVLLLVPARFVAVQEYVPSITTVVMGASNTLSFSMRVAIAISVPLTRMRTIGFGEPMARQTIETFSPLTKLGRVVVNDRIAGASALRQNSH